ncbi:HYR domain-containing protein [Leifsonia sp. Leaf264]|uniref:HYR domain-containing protein n=1 Tax=Leifsonia sp. Leaf264 TaxID=1736314 RepID=UPI001F2EEEAD|nr:HYR domain-containing protein [Leifsonia sp. Leaf264]
MLWTLVSEPPALTIDVPDDIVVPNDPGEAGAEVAFALPTTAGGVPPTTVDCDAASGDFFPIGVTTVNCTATDSDQSMFEIILFAVVADSFTITVEDVEPPVIADNPDLVRTTPGPSVVVDFVNPVATDNSGDDPTVECVPASGTSFAVGVSTVTCTATDAAGNTATSSFTVTVTTATSEEPTPSPTPTPGSPGDSGSPGGGTSGGGGSGTGTGTMASTGVAASGSLHLALLMLIAGAALLLATRRRSHPGR